MAAFRADIREIEGRRGVKVVEETINSDAPAVSSEQIVGAIERVADEVGASHRRMVSRAYHDSSFMARVAPMAMIFIPCRAGVSHRPDEYATVEAIALGTEVLAKVMAELASDLATGA
jgi:N-carbamoyl-L-amino-acid hydrolase